MVANGQLASSPVQNPAEQRRAAPVRLRGMLRGKRLWQALQGCLESARGERAAALPFRGVACVFAPEEDRQEKNLKAQEDIRDFTRALTLLSFGQAGIAFVQTSE
jgi:hypothetical protein